jgi:hypothetical protein
MCNLYSITTNQAAIIALFRVVNRYVSVTGATSPLHWTCLRPFATCKIKTLRTATAFLKS